MERDTVVEQIREALTVRRPREITELRRLFVQPRAITVLCVDDNGGDQRRGDVRGVPIALVIDICPAAPRPNGDRNTSPVLAHRCDLRGPHVQGQFGVEVGGLLRRHF